MPAASALLPLSAGGSTGSAEIIPEPHPLSEESAKGFRQLLTAHGRLISHFIILPAVRQLSLENAKKLQQRATSGSWLILESGVAYSFPEEAARQAQILAQVFNFHVREPIAISTGEPSYLTYNCPQPIMVRTFGAITPVSCSPSERLAEFAGIPIAAKRSVGRGGIIYLGSILGAGLLAQEREARQVASALLRA